MRWKLTCYTLIFKVDVLISPGTHASEGPGNDSITITLYVGHQLGMFDSVNKQLADKERIAAALENGHLLDVVNQCLSGIDD